MMEDKKWWKRMTDEMQIKLSNGIRYYGNSNFRFKKDYALNFNGKTYWSDDTGELVKMAFLDWEKTDGR